MPRTTANASSGTWTLLAVLTMGGIAIFMGWAIGNDLAGVPVYLIEVLAIVVFMFVAPTYSLLLYLVISSVFPYIPPSILGEGVSTDTYVFGLSAPNIVFMLMIAVWGMRFVVLKEEVPPIGPLGKTLLLYVGFNAVNLMRTIIIRTLFDTASPDTVATHLSLWRSDMTIPIVTFLIVTVKQDRRFFFQVYYLNIFTLCIGFVYAFAELMTTNLGGFDAVLAMRNAPVNMLALGPIFYAFALAVVVLSRRFLVKAFWIGMMIIAALPIAYLHRRATYITVFTIIVVLMFFLVRDKKIRVSRALLILTFIATVTVYYAPKTAVERVEYTFESSGTVRKERLDPSVGIRLKMAKLSLAWMWEHPWSFFTGVGYNRSSSIVRRLIGHGLSTHNVWLGTLLDGGIVAVIILILCFVQFYKAFGILRASSDPKVYALGVVMQSFIFAVQITMLVHPIGLTIGAQAVFLWLTGGLIIAQLRPGGMLADTRLPDGRLGRELLGYPGEDAEQQTEEAPEPLAAVTSNTPVKGM